jgi:hypothetical protein
VTDLLKRSAEASLEKLKHADLSHYTELTETYQLTADKIAKYALAFYKKSNAKNKYKDIADFLHQHFSGEISTSPIDAYIHYLMSKQSYAVNTVNAGEGMPILSRVLGIYRHGYIQIYDSPFKNGKHNDNKNHEILELNPSAQTHEGSAKSVSAQIRVVPGIITMALHLAGEERLATGEYRLINYRPWVNDCQTYFKHTQETMNEMLVKIDPDVGPALSQKVIDHYRYRPQIDTKEAQWLRRQAGLHLNPDQKIFKVNKKGLGVLNVSDNKDFRNVLEDRKRDVSPSGNILSYTGWVMKQFASSTLDRGLKYLKYKKTELVTKGKIHSLVQYLRNEDRFLREMTSVLAVDFMKMKLNASQEAQFIPYYIDMAIFQEILVKNKAELSDLLKQLNADPFNTMLNVKVNEKKQQIIEDSQALRKSIVNIYNLMNRYDIKAPKEKKNMLDAIQDLKKHQNDFTLKVEKVLYSGVKPSGVKPEFVHFNLNAKKSERKRSELTETGQKIDRKIENFLTTVVQQYAKSMADPKAKLWAGDVEIQQLGNLKNLTIYVHHKNSRRQPDVLGVANGQHTIHLLYSNGNHYEVCDEEGVRTQKTMGNGNCLFEAIIKAEKAALNKNNALSNFELESKIASLRRQVSEQILKNYREIESGTAFHQPPGYKGDAVKLTPSDDPIWVRFKAIFEAENKHQLQEALNLLPDGALKTQAQQLKIEHNQFLAQEARSAVRSKFNL